MLVDMYGSSDAIGLRELWPIPVPFTMLSVVCHVAIPPSTSSDYLMPH